MTQSRIYKQGKLASAASAAAGGDDVSQSANAARFDEEAAPPSAKQSTALLLTLEQSAALLGLSNRRFQQLRDAEWMPRPIQLSQRMVRWSRVELEAAIIAMPRQQTRAEPLELARARAAKSAPTVTA